MDILDFLGDLRHSPCETLCRGGRVDEVMLMRGRQVGSAGKAHRSSSLRRDMGRLELHPAEPSIDFTAEQSQERTEVEVRETRKWGS